MPGIDWDTHYQSDQPPWENGLPSEELRRVIAEQRISPSRVIELGCDRAQGFLLARPVGNAAFEALLAHR